MKCETVYLAEEFPFLGKNGAAPRLDVYLPYNMSEMRRERMRRPCMVVLPGGGYGMCSQREGEAVGVHFLPEGYNVFVLWYSVAPDFRFPTQITEVAAVMELIYRNAESWNCDTSKIAIMGFSAGGHLAAHYSTAWDCEEVRAVFPESKRVNASVLCYPVISADPRDSHWGSILNLLGHEPSAEEIQRFSCERLVTKNTPPAFLWHTSTDGAVPVKNSLIYAAALAENGVPVEAHIYPYGQHGLSTSDKQTLDDPNRNTDYAADWLVQVKRWLKLMFD